MLPRLVRLVVFLILLASGCASYGSSQPSGPVTSASPYTAAAYQDDIDELVTRLIQTHPKPFEFTPEAEFRQIVSNVQARISDNTTPRQFIWMFGSIVSSLGCGHTTLGYFNQEDALLPDSLRFPVDAQFLNGRLYITDPLFNEDVLAPGDEILSVNGIDIPLLRTELLSHVPADAHLETASDVMINAYLTAYMAYVLDSPSSYEVTTRSHPSPQRLRPLVTYDYPPLTPPNAPCQDKLCVRWLDDMDTAVVTVRSFAYYGNDFHIFKGFVDQTFASLAERDTPHLIIDVRGNSGGSGFASSYLLQHLADRSFRYYREESAGSPELKLPQTPAATRFAGNVFILADGGGWSSTGHFLSMVKGNGWGTIIGQEAGATYTVNDNAVGFSATHTGIEYRIARSTFATTAEGLPNTQGVLPDHAVAPSIEDVLTGTDTVLEFTLALVSSEEHSE